MDSDPFARDPATTSDAGESVAKPLALVGRDVNRTSEFVLDLLSATALIPPDRLAPLRTGGSIVEALVDQGLVQPEAIARSLALHHGLPYVDLGMLPMDEQAAATLPLHVLERVGAVPYALAEGVLSIAVTNPANVHGLDELRLAARYPVEFGVASSDLVDDRIRRLVRSSEAFGVRSGAVDEPLLLLEDAVDPVADDE